MPVDSNRFGDPEIGQDRLPGDHGSQEPIQWMCQLCQNVHHGRPEQGCPICGAGTPGMKAPIPPAFDALTTLEARTPAARAETAPSLAERITAQRRPGITIDEIRQAIREELREALVNPIPSFTDKERLAVVEGLKVILIYLRDGDLADAAAHYPSPDELTVLLSKLQQGE